MVKPTPKIIDATQLASAADVAELREQVDDLCDKLQKLIDVLTVKPKAKGERVARARDYNARQAFIMRQTRAAKRLGFTRAEFVDRFGNTDRVPLGAASKTSETKKRRRA